MDKKILTNPNLNLRIISLQDHYHHKIFEIFMTREETTSFAKIAANIEKEILCSSPKEASRVYRPIIINPIRKAFLREPALFKVGTIDGINQLVCLITGELINKSEDCIVFIIKTENQGYVISAAIKRIEDFRKLLQTGSIYKKSTP